MRLFARKPGTPFGQGDKGHVENYVRAQAEALSLVCSSMGHVEFLQHCVESMPRNPVRRDTRKQRLVRAMRRMHERGDLPFKVEGELFVFD